MPRPWLRDCWISGRPAWFSSVRSSSALSSESPTTSPSARDERDARADQVAERVRFGVELFAASRRGGATASRPPAAPRDERSLDQRVHASAAPTMTRASSTPMSVSAGRGERRGGRGGSRNVTATVRELVAELLDRLDRVGEHRQLFAQPPDVDVDGARAAGVVVAPDVGQQQIARQHAAAMLDEILQQQELLGRQPHVARRRRSPCRSEIDRDAGRTAASPPAAGPSARGAAARATRATSSFGLNGLVT